MLVFSFELGRFGGALSFDRLRTNGLGWLRANDRGGLGMSGFGVGDLGFRLRGNDGIGCGNDGIGCGDDG